MGQPAVFAGLGASLKLRCLEAETYYAFASWAFQPGSTVTQEALNFFAIKA
jgi:hypothetical protein